ncbi:MAG: polyisoprenoid-binding protein [Burkholderiales bacterium]|nr:polyisoprenoid-binding protein [Burkholderiales bacterium]
MKKTHVFVTLLAVAVAAPALAAETYTIDPNHTLPVYEINHFGWSTQRGRFNKVSGKITLDRSAKTGSMQVTIDVASVDSGVAKLDEHLTSEDFFDVAKHPTMSFKADKIVFEGDKPKSVPGQFTLLGVTKPLTLTINSFHCAHNAFAKKDACGADAVATIKRSDFGMDTYLPGLGDEVKLLINVEAFKD